MSTKIRNLRQNILPVELWQKIFTFATTIDGKDEFSTERSAYFTMPCEDTTATPILTVGQQMMIIKTRCRIVRTCRNWYAIGIRSLWSHLLLRYGTFIPILDALQQNPLKLGNIVLRVSFTESPDPYGLGWLTHRLTLIFDLLPNLRILSGPIIVPHKIQSNCWMTASIQDYIKPSEFNRLACLWDNINTLSVQLQWASDIVQQYFTFSRVENLNIVTDGSPAPHGITSYWRFPSVHTVSLKFPSSNLHAWINFLEMYKNQLQILQIAIQNCRNGSPLAVRMPKLRALYLEEPTTADVFLGSIDAPNVQRLGIFGIKPTPSTPTLGVLFFGINRVVNKFSKVNQLCLVLASYPSPFSFPDSDEEQLEIWRRRGISVQVTHETDTSKAV